MSKLNLNNAEFVKSAVSEKQFINTSLPKVVFAGKSNVGKSSVINCILNRNNFARVGNTPGKTVNVNYFRIDSRLLLVDLPGYGFANVSKSERERWGKLMEDYFRQIDAVSLGVFIVDSRHAPTKDDINMAEWFCASEKPFVVVANKTDKLKKSEIDNNISIIRMNLNLASATDVIPFSAKNGQGRDELVKRILDLV